MAGGTGEGLGQDASLQQILAALGMSTPQGGTGTGQAQDATLQKLLTAVSGGAASASYVFQPGGTASGNVFTTWGSLYTALSLVQGAKIITIDDSFSSPAIIPAGTWNLSGVTFAAVTNFTTPTGGAHLQFADGATIVPSNGTLRFSSAIYATTVSNATAVLSPSSGQGPIINVTEGAILSSLGNAPFLACANGSFPLVVAHVDCTLGDGTHNLITLTASASCALSAFGATVSANLIGGAGAASASIFFDSASKIGAPLSGKLTYLHVISVVQYGADPTGTSDSSSAFATTFTLAALLGIPALIPAGTFKIANPVTLPSGVTVIGTAATTIVSTIVGGGNPLNTTFVCTQTSAGASTTISSPNTVGTNTVSVAASIAAGKTIRILAAAAGSNRGQTYTVESVTGAGPFTLTLDRPVWIQFAAADSVLPVTAPTGITIQGNGMTMTGTGDRYMEFSGAVRARVSGVIMSAASGSPDSFCMSFDIASYDCKGDHIYADGGAAVNSVFGAESSESSVYEDCVGIRPKTARAVFAIWDCYFQTLRHCAGEGAPIGCEVTDDVTGLGSFHTYLLDCNFSSCADGVTITQNSLDTVVDVTADSCSAVGVSNSGLNSKITVRARNCGVGVQCDSNAQNSTIVYADVDGSGSASAGAVNLISDTRILDFSNLAIGAGNIGLWCQAGTYRVRIHGGMAKVTGVGGQFAQVDNNVQLSMEDTDVNLAANNALGLVTGGANTVAKCADVQIRATGGATGTTGFYANHGTIYLNPLCDSSSCATPINQPNVDSFIVPEQGSGLYADATAMGTVTLTMPQSLQNGTMKLTGNLSGNLTYNVPALKGLKYIVDASGVTLNAHTLNVGPAGGTVSLTAAQHVIYSDGTNAHTVV